MFTNAIMVVQGVELNEETFSKLKNMRLMNLVSNDGVDTKVEYLYKDIPDQALENYKNRLVLHILVAHLLSCRFRGTIDGIIC